MNSIFIHIECEIHWKQNRQKAELECKQEMGLFYGTVFSMLSIFDCFRCDVSFVGDIDLRFSLNGDEVSFLSEWDFSPVFSSDGGIVSIEIESSLIPLTGDDWRRDDDCSEEEERRSVDCWTRPKELNNCFSLPDDVDVGIASKNIGVVFGNVEGDGSDFFVLVSDDEWGAVVVGLSSS